MENLEIFKYENNEVRTVIKENNDIYFNLKDVCGILEINNPSQALTRLNSKGVISNETLTKGGKQKLNYISESNLYKLMFQSRKPEAEKFTEWVTSEVLPSIRKHGTYMTPDTLEQALLSPDFLIKIANQLKEEQAKVKTLENKIEENKPKVIFADAVATAKNSVLVGDLAKTLKQNGVEIGATRLFKWLRENGYLGIRGENYNIPTQKSMELKIMELKQTTSVNPDGSIRTNKTPKITGKGQQYFLNKFLNEEKGEE